MSSDRETQIREQVAKAEWAAGIQDLKAGLDLRVAEKVALEANLGPAETAKLRNFLHSCNTNEDRTGAEIFMVEAADIRSAIEGDGVPVVGASAPRGKFQVVYGSDQPAPESFQTRDSLASIYEQHRAVFALNMATQDTTAAHGTGMGQADFARPPDPAKPEGQAVLRKAFEEALEDTRIGEDKEARKLILAAASDNRLLDEIEIHTVMRRRPGASKVNPQDPESYRAVTVVCQWPEEPSLPKWEPADGTPPPAGSAFIQRTRTLRSLAADLHERSRVRFYHGKDADQLLAPRPKLFW